MKILVCPLNWGLGHATRCVPIIQQLIADGHTPVLVSDGFPLSFLKQEFPTLLTIEYPSYSIAYSKGSSQVFAMLRSFPSIVTGIIQEHLWLKKLLKQEHFDQVLSDNRFGMWNKGVHSIYITHQLMVKMPNGLKSLEPMVWWLHRQFIRCYAECWIPDFKERSLSLSGDLSHKYPLLPNQQFIGPLSRFGSYKECLPNDDYKVVAVLSGVEPHRSLWEKELIAAFREATFKTLIVRGAPCETPVEEKLGMLTLVSHLSSKELARVLLGADRILSRSGYSSIMDFKALGCLQKVEFVPTPGQTEQEYLAKIHSNF